MRTATLWLILLIGGCGSTPPAEAPPASAITEPATPLRVVVDQAGDYATYTNTSTQPVWVLAYTPDQPLYHLETFADRGGWKDYSIGWCGTGAERHEIAPGDRHRFRVVPDLAGHVWRVSVVYYTSPSGGQFALAPSRARAG